MAIDKSGNTLVSIRTLALGTTKSKTKEPICQDISEFYDVLYYKDFGGLSYTSGIYVIEASQDILNNQSNYQFVIAKVSVNKAT